MLKVSKSFHPKLLVRHKTTLTDEQYQYLQRSILPSYYFQKSLPRLPIPTLENTCNRYLAAQRPLLDNEAYAKTEGFVNDFRKNQGPKLQELLIAHDKANKHTSYISEPWFDMYLRDRAPLPVNYNPLLIMKPDTKPEMNEPTVRTSNLIISSLRFMNSLRKGILKPEIFHMDPSKSDTERFARIMKMVPTIVATYVAYTFKAYPLDMSQYEGLFAATRIPEPDKDRIFRAANPKHIVIFNKGNAFTMDVLDEHGNIESPSVIMGRVKHVFNLAQGSKPNEFPVGAMTTENRNTWASIRKHIMKIGNGNSLRLIDSALFAISLDEETFDESQPIPMIKNMLYENGTNRWYDKSFSLIVAKDGTTGLNFEHSWGDGVAVLRYFNEIYKETTEKPFVTPNTDTRVNDDLDKAVHRVDFELDEKARESIKEALKSHKSICDSLDLNFLKYPGINKDECKRRKASPDSVMQLAFQLAFYKQNQKFVATYESCSTSAFRHGRTETMRPCTNETKKFVETLMKDKNASKQELRALLDACSTKHFQLTKEAAMGQGFDRHLFGLRHTADKNGIAYPGIFTDPAYAQINHNILSTSTLNSPAIVAGGFGPVVKDGYGIGYSIHNDFSGCVVSSYKNTRNGGDFLGCIESAFKDIEQVLQAKKTEGK
ncbi:carnitine O-palmitoyltransferase 2, mitochondrial [Culicoides brevitarsis]|uniref:carnitine O-palmitoyltransferase 2, mitochondrial n=1 Tax=Culicoides brevitarsis TaxID=469753 RepID=UPI00307C55E0